MCDFKRKVQSYLLSFMQWSSKMAGKPLTFVIAILVVLAWTLIGLLAGMSDTWLLIINTLATINASLMVFIIQSTQYRESKALHLKIDELILAIKEAEAEMAMIEEKEEEELEKIRKAIGLKKRQQLEDGKRKSL